MSRMDWDAYAATQGRGTRTARRDSRRMATRARSSSFAWRWPRRRRARTADAGSPRRRSGWLIRSAERYRESFAGAPPRQLGEGRRRRKAGLLAGDRGGGGRRDVGARSSSRRERLPDRALRGALAQLVLGSTRTPAVTAGSLQREAPERSRRPWLPRSMRSRRRDSPALRRRRTGRSRVVRGAGGVPRGRSGGRHGARAGAAREA